MRETEATDNGSHPDLDRWIAYQAGDLGRSDEGSLQDHLVDCRSCTALMLDLESFADSTTVGADGDSPGAASRSVSDFEKAAVWRSLRPHLRRRRWTVPATVAASFLAAALGVGLWQQQRELSGLRLEVAELSKPQANAPVYDLYPRATLRSGASPGPTLEVPAEAPTLLLILNGAEDAGAAGGAWRLEILDAEGRPVAGVDGLMMDEMGVFTFALPRTALATGDHVVRLWGPGAGEAPVEEYPLRIVYR